MLTLKQENETCVRSILVRFFSYGVSEKGRGGVFASWKEQEKYREYFSCDYLHDPDIRVCGYIYSREWKGELPQDGEKWLCEMIRVTDGGLLLVKPLENETKRKKLEYREEVFSQAIGLDPLFKYVGDLRVDEDEVDDFMLKAVLYILELKKFAEEKIAKEGRLPMIRKMIIEEDWQLFDFGSNDIFKSSSTGALANAYDEYSAGKYMGQKKSLKAIISWLERDENVVEIIASVKRNYKCGCCQHSFRLEKAICQNIKKAGFVVRCPDCGANSGK